MSLILVEEHPENFQPLTFTCATFELRYGTQTPLERALQITPHVSLRCRPEIAADVRSRTGLPVNEDAEGEGAPGLPCETPWNLLAKSDAFIAADYEAWQHRRTNYRDTALMNGAHIVGSASDVFIGQGSYVQPGCVLDVTNGPIIIGDNVQVKWSQIQGPVFVGNGCTLDGARLRPGTSVGDACKIGGEVSATIFQGNANKAHDGFVGNSWIGRWVNFGALATASNLKNTYSEIRYKIDSRTTVETGLQFLGSLVGEHSKIGIGQMLTTGSNIGVGCCIYGGGVAPSYIPSFSWGGIEGWTEHRFEAFEKTARAVFARRKLDLSASTVQHFRDVFDATQAERDKFLAARQ